LHALSTGKDGERRHRRNAEDACEAMEAATVLLVRRLAQIGRLSHSKTKVQ
jgi:hypothetical protein